MEDNIQRAYDDLLVLYGKMGDRLGVHASARVDLLTDLLAVETSLIKTDDKEMAVSYKDQALCKYFESIGAHDVLNTLDNLPTGW